MKKRVLENIKYLSINQKINSILSYKIYIRKLVIKKNLAQLYHKFTTKLMLTYQDGTILDQQNNKS
jgi:hypothetical protein